MPSYHDLIKTDINAILSPAIENLVDLVTEQVAETHTNALNICEKYRLALNKIAESDHDTTSLIEVVNIAKNALK